MNQNEEKLLHIRAKGWLLPKSLSQGVVFGLPKLLCQELLCQAVLGFETGTKTEIGIRIGSLLGS